MAIRCPIPRTLLPLAAITMLVVGCQNMEDGQVAGAAFCACLQDNNPHTADQVVNQRTAQLICEGELVKRSHNYRVFKVDMQTHDTITEINWAERERSRRFANAFVHYVNKHCKVSSY
ncbi:MULTISPECIES: hypothetical protein [Hymenobacter]|uniref:Lipoprotein n=1 Tax=Hymenobacter mucosus TaxID=1411120 RepID=A0A239BFX2_9BACT|nr:MULTISPECIES: hypothetical protein [Hymenobacter]MDF7815934.1 hypothetical protein [Hymenobacter sp. YC55]SNS06955.1 hypothetical protein SAMN06269173_12329 [Hymenobacter mucosus]